MAIELTEDEKQFAKDQYSISELKKQRLAVIKSAEIALTTKRSEITAIQSELNSDVAAIDAQIKALE